MSAACPCDFLTCRECREGVRRVDLVHDSETGQKLRAITAAIRAYRETGSNPDRTIRSIESVLGMDVQTDTGE